MLWGESTSLAAPRAVWNAGSLPTILSRAWAPGLALPQSQGRERGFPARAPTFQLTAVVGGVPVLLILPVVPRGRFVPRHL